MSDYRSTEVSTLMLKSLRKDFMPTGLFLVRLPQELGRAPPAASLLQMVFKGGPGDVAPYEGRASLTVANT